MIKLFSADLDGTLLGEKEATRRFNEAWSRLQERPLLCYNSGRLLGDMLSVVRSESLPQPDFLIGGVGTQLYDARKYQSVTGFEEQFSSGWDLEKVEGVLASFSGIIRQPAEYLNPYKSSWYLDHADIGTVKAVRERLAGAGLNITLIYSHGYDLDVLPANAGKGHALKWLCGQMGISLEQVLVAGDSANDSAMFLLPKVRGIVVANAHSDFLESVAHLPAYRATGGFADGVLQGLEHFGVVQGNAKKA